MEYEREQLDATEQALAELREAELAGVFQPTRVKAGEVLRAGMPSQAMGLRRLSVRLVAVAAVLMLAVTVWTGMFQREFANLREQKNALVAAVSPVGAGSMSFADCMSGPSVTLTSSACSLHDHNGDGVVDLRDYSTLQLASARVDP